MRSHTITQSVRNILPDRLNTHSGDIETIAKDLGLSVKKLQRLLKDEGTTYSEILENVRYLSAMHLLGETNKPIKSIAFSLGYSSGEAFNTACQRWFGLSPRNYRQKISTLRKDET